MLRLRYISAWLLLAIASGCEPSSKPGQPGPQNQAANPPANAADETAPSLAPKRAALQFGEGKASTQRNLYIVFDGSGSMAQGLKQPGEQKFANKLVGAKWAVREFLKTIPDDINLGLFVFDASGVREVVSLGSGNRNQFLNEINRVRASGGTPLGESIMAGVDALMVKYQQQLGYGDFRLIVVTDGEANPDTMNSAVQYAQDYGVPIFTIGLDVQSNHSLRDSSRQFFSAKSFEELKKGLIDATAESETFDENTFPNN
jgi:Ca-activated chloride channel homolog